MCQEAMCAGEKGLTGVATGKCFRTASLCRRGSLLEWRWTSSSDHLLLTIVRALSPSAIPRSVWFVAWHCVQHDREPTMQCSLMASQ